MYKILGIFVTLAVITGSQISYAADADKSMIGLWLFDEGKGDVAKDSTSNKNDGEISNCKWAEGVFETALEFNGADSCITVTHSESLSISDSKISITAWFTQDGSAAGNWHTIVCKGPMKVGDATENWAVFTNSQAQYICTTLTMEGGERWWTTSGDGTVPIDGEWRHFATTYDGEELNYYLDAELVNTLPKTGNILPNDRDLTIGCRFDDGIRWGGMIDEIGIFNRVLTQEEIRRIMEDGYMDYLAVELVGKLVTVWGELRR